MAKLSANRRDVANIKKKFATNIDVVTVAKQRIKNIFSNRVPVLLSMSGGKDSICLNNLVYEMAQSGEIDKSLLRVAFVDEEAIYPCVEEIVLNIRKQWVLLGVPFDWYAMEFRHFNCLNQLSSDESFICFDETKRDKWIRKPPSFAIRDCAGFRRRLDTYQDFFKRTNKGIQIIGVRAAESVQRADNIVRTSIETTGNAFPIYDWKETDVWKYLYDKNLPFPKAYMYMYQCGVPMNRMRISQFFSVDTIGALVKMCEFYPNLFDRICRREPNAYMAMLYYDTEIFRRKKQAGKVKDTTDYKAKTLELINSPHLFDTKSKRTLHRNMRRILVKYSIYFEEVHWKKAYNVLVGGDPKRRSMRSLMSSVFSTLSKKTDQEIKQRGQ